MSSLIILPCLNTILHSLKPHRKRANLTSSVEKLGVDHPPFLLGKATQEAVLKEINTEGTCQVEHKYAGYIRLPSGALYHPSQVDREDPIAMGLHADSPVTSRLRRLYMSPRSMKAIGANVVRPGDPNLDSPDTRALHDSLQWPTREEQKKVQTASEVIAYNRMFLLRKEFLSKARLEAQCRSIEGKV